MTLVAGLTRDDLVGAAADLNEVLCLDPRIRAKRLGDTELGKQILEASGLVDRSDVLDSRTRAVIKQLTEKGA